MQIFFWKFIIAIIVAIAVASCLVFGAYVSGDDSGTLKKIVQNSTPFSAGIEPGSHNERYVVYIVRSNCGHASEEWLGIWQSHVSAVGNSINWQNNPDNRRIPLAGDADDEVTLFTVRTSGE